MFYSPRTRYIALFSIIVSTFMTSSLATSFSVHDVKMRSSNRHTSGADNHHQAPTVAHHLMMNSLRGGEGNAIQNLYGKYMSSLDTSPLTTKSITAGVVQALGDFLSQYIEAKVAKVPFVLNGSRLRAFLISGVFFVGPFLHYWYSFLWRIGSWAEVKYKAGKKVQTLLQVFTDQTLGVAVFFPLFFYVYELSEALSSWRGTTLLLLLLLLLVSRFGVHLSLFVLTFDCAYLFHVPFVHSPSNGGSTRQAKGGACQCISHSILHLAHYQLV
jgi:hypothetical protein